MSQPPPAHAAILEEASLALADIMTALTQTRGLLARRFLVLSGVRILAFIRAAAPGFRPDDELESLELAVVGALAPTAE